MSDTTYPTSRTLRRVQGNKLGTRKQAKRTTPSGTVITVKVDSKGRLLIPRSIREKLKMTTGDVCFLTLDQALGILSVAKAENPFDGLARHAIREYRAGQTKSLRQYVKEQGVEINKDE